MPRDLARSVGLKGFSRESLFEPGLNIERGVLRNLVRHLEALREGAGPEVDILLDLNFNVKTEGYLKILRAIAELDIFWVEIDSFVPEALGYIRRQSPHPISSCETLLGLREFMPYFREQAMDVAIVDVPWNGIWQSMKIAAAAEAHEVNVAPHNFYGHLCTMMNAHFCAAVPNFRIMETDIDRLAWDDDLVTHPPDHFRRIGNFHMLKGDAITGLNLFRRPGDIGVDRFGTRPGIEVNRLALYFCFKRRPIRGVAGFREKRKQSRSTCSLNQITPGKLHYGSCVAALS